MSCIVRGCKSHSSRKGNEVETVTFHRFPTYIKRRQIWIDAIAQHNWKWKEHNRICSKHFTPQCFSNIDHKWRRLEYIAVPSLYLHKDEPIMCHNEVPSTNAPSTNTSSTSPISKRTPSTSAPTISFPTISPPIISAPSNSSTSSNAPSPREIVLMKHVAELQQDLAKLRIISKRRLLKINALRQKTNRLKTKNTVLSLRLMDLSEKKNIEKKIFSC